LKVKTQTSGDTMPLKFQRIDKWLWYSRLIKTRTQASRLIAAGKVRVNRTRVQKPAANLHVGDVVTAVINGRVRVAKIMELGRRRGPPMEASLLYEDLTPVQNSASPSKNDFPVKAPSRDKGMGRPTKRDRRKLDHFRDKAHFSDN